MSQHLEEEILSLRNDYQTRIHDREVYIADLKEEIQQLRGKIEEYTMILIPLQRGGIFGKRPDTPAPVFQSSIESEDSWAAIQAKHYAEQEAQAEADKNQ